MTITNHRVTEHRIPFRTHTTWARVTEPQHRSLDLPPIIILHGGPGVPHDYCLPMTRFCEEGRAVVHYDQLGCGRSTRLAEAPKDFWTVDLFVDELRNLVDYLGLGDGFHLLGQSWGGMLAPEYVLRHPAGVLSMTLADSPASMPLWTEGTQQLLAQLPAEIQATILEEEEAGTTESAAYQGAINAFYQRHVCRIDPFPEPLQSSFARMAEDPTVYHTMVGPSEFSAVGTLKDWSIIDRLPQISTPALVVAGEFDEATPLCWQPFVDHLQNAAQHVFEGASHMPHLETPDEFFAVVGDFLRRHDTINN